MLFSSHLVQKTPYVLFLRAYDGPDLIIENEVFGERAQTNLIGQRDGLVDEGVVCYML